MLNVLYKAEQDLPKLLSTKSIWNSLLIDYNKPYVERLWCTWGEYRINLHRIGHCTTAEALFHPHPWPSAMRLVSGQYKMGVGYSASESTPRCAATVVLNPGSVYEMTELHGWHYVQPVTDNTLSVMITGRPWVRKGPQSNKRLKPLKSLIKQEILDEFSYHY